MQVQCQVMYSKQNTRPPAHTGKYVLSEQVGPPLVKPALLKAEGAPHSEDTMTLWRGWYQKSYPYLVSLVLHVPFTCDSISKGETETEDEACSKLGCQISPTGTRPRRR